MAGLADCARTGTDEPSQWADLRAHAPDIGRSDSCAGSGELNARDDSAVGRFWAEALGWSVSLATIMDVA